MSFPLFIAALAFIASNAFFTALLIRLMRPLLVRYALARPNARSLHAVPTPQGGGIAIMLVMLVMLGLAIWQRPLAPQDMRIIFHVAGAAAALALVGAIDDIRPIPSVPRLALQLVFAWIALLATPPETRILGDILPAEIERALLVIALAWFVNLTNFMDGMDWMSVVEMVPLCVSLLICASLGLLPPGAALIIAALLGGLIGFAPFNMPVARLFLGDVGSLPLGLCVGLALILLAARGHLAAALLLSLYYIADSSVTLLWRISRRERLWEAHRSHFYQTAIARGWSVRAVLVRVFALNLALAALAFGSIFAGGAAVQVLCVVIGIVAVSLVLLSFSKDATPLLP